MTDRASINGNGDFSGSRYFEKIRETFGSLTSDNERTDYVRAISDCFKTSEENPPSHFEICQNYGFSPYKARDYYFVLAKKHAVEFFVQDMRVPGVNTSSIRGLTLPLYKARFETDTSYRNSFGRDRLPFTKGRSSYYLTPAEWIMYLDIRCTLPLPNELSGFINSKGSTS